MQIKLIEAEEENRRLPYSKALMENTSLPAEDGRVGRGAGGGERRIRHCELFIAMYEIQVSSAANL